LFSLFHFCHDQITLGTRELGVSVKGKQFEKSLSSKFAKSTKPIKINCQDSLPANNHKHLKVAAKYRKEKSRTEYSTTEKRKGVS